MVLCAKEFCSSLGMLTSYVVIPTVITKQASICMLEVRTAIPRFPDSRHLIK